MRLARAGAVVLLGLAACTSEPGSSPRAVPAATAATPTPQGAAHGREPELDLRNVDVAVETLVSGLEAPVAAMHAPGDDTLYVVEKTGRVVSVRDDRVDRPLLDIRGSVSTGSEQGLLGLAFHPRFESNARFFVNYTDTAGDTVIAEFRATTGTSSIQDQRVLMTIDQPFPNHNGGHVQFGPDGYLYIGLGDGGSAGDPEENGQDTEALLGKILRIDVDGRSGAKPYGIPSDNPFADGGGAPEVWLYGLRNPWRFSFDEEGRSLWIGDVGQDELEEIDRVPIGEGGGNLGWDVMEASGCFEPAAGCDRNEMVLPVAEYGHELGCSVTGGVVYRGARIRGLTGAYLFADFCSGRVWGLDPKGGDPVQLVESAGSISSFGEAPDGEVYLTDLTGSVHRLVPNRK